MDILDWTYASSLFLIKVTTVLEVDMFQMNYIHCHYK